MSTKPEWNLRTLLQSPMFAPLHGTLAHMHGDRFPTLDELDELIARSEKQIITQNGKPVRFVEQVFGNLPFEAQYEPRCYLTGEVQSRPDNWHDLFNALVWLVFPKAKAAINARHYRAMSNETYSVAGQRGSERDMLTLFDESGAIVVYADEELAELLKTFRWKDLFWQQRERVNAAMGFHLFGHGLYEKAVRPYVGMTGQGLVLEVDHAFFTWSLSERLSCLDGLLADYLLAPENCRNTRELTPVPVLGVPGWTVENDAPAYYDNSRYFRGMRHTSTAS
jgi:hypothetical protein